MSTEMNILPHSPELYNTARDRLFTLLQKITVPLIRKTHTLSNGKIIYERDNVIGSIGRTFSFGYGQTRRKGYATLVATLKYPHIMKALVEYGNLVVPTGFHYNMITVNHGVKAKKHTDGKNVGDSVIVGFGDYTGGHLRLYDSDTTYKAHSIKDAPLLFNGSVVPHETEEFQGTRYTLIFYSQGRHPVPGYTTVGGAVALPDIPTLPTVVASPPLHLVYLATPRYGGWVTFTAHMALKYQLALFKLSKRTERKSRPFGYDVSYTNTATFPSGRLLITAIDKHYYHLLDSVPSGSSLVLHDPTEIKPQLLTFLRTGTCKLFVIRKTMQDYLQTLGLPSTFLPHPFFAYPLPAPTTRTSAVTISRIDYDKNLDIVLNANKSLAEPIALHGFPNQRYVHFKLAALDYAKHYRGSFPKSFQALSAILQTAKYVVDLSIIKNDGDGTQYTTLEAIYHDCTLILHSKWVSPASEFKHGLNCITVSTPEELIEALNLLSYDAKPLLQKHLDVDWPSFLP